MHLCHFEMRLHNAVVFLQKNYLIFEQLHFTTESMSYLILFCFYTSKMRPGSLPTIQA